VIENKKEELLRPKLKFLPKSIIWN